MQGTTLLDAVGRTIDDVDGALHARRSGPKVVAIPPGRGRQQDYSRSASRDDQHQQEVQLGFIFLRQYEPSPPPAKSIDQDV